MFPVLFAFGPVTITTLGVLALLSFFFGSFSIWRRAKQEHIEDADVFDLTFISFIVGLIGGRVGYILINLGDFGLNIQSWLYSSASHGFAWFGFLIGWMLGMKWVCAHKKWKFYELADITVLGIITSQILLRLGQFFDSSFVGANTNLPWGLPFPGFEGRQHPLSLYEIPFLFFLIWLIKYLDKHYRLYKWYRGSRGEAKPGFLWLSYLFWLTIFHFIIDFVFLRQTAFLFISYRQLWLFGMFLFTVFWFWWQAGDSFDILKFKQKWLGKTDNNTAKPARVIKKEETFEPNSQEIADNKIGIDKNISINSTPNTTVATGRRFFRSRK